MHYGEGWILVLLAMMAIDLRHGLRVAVEVLPILWFTLLTVNLPLKRFFRRRRPFVAFVKARVLGPRPQDFSLPSGHAAAGFAGAFLLSIHAPLFAPIFYAIAAVVGLSRVYLGVHYPSDVVIGAAAGTVLAAIYRWILLAVTPLGG
jgi:undecaprenyl-diphosphatase